MIFFTAGEAVRRVEPAHMPYADVFGVWPVQLSGSSFPALRLKAPLEEVSKPYRRPRDARSDALELIARVAPRLTTGQSSITEPPSSRTCIA